MPRMMTVPAASVDPDLLAAHYGGIQAVAMIRRSAEVELPVAILYPLDATADDDDVTPDEHLARLLEEDRQAFRQELDPEAPVPADPPLDVARAFLAFLADRGLVVVRIEDEER